MVQNHTGDTQIKSKASESNTSTFIKGKGETYANRVYRWVSSFDEISEPSYSNLHFKGDANHKNFLNGIVSFLIKCYLLYLVVKYSN